MDTIRLFYEDCHKKEFTACVTGCETQKQGYGVTLNATAFYPEGGGQAWDLGKIGEANVLSVTEEAGQIIHLCDRPLPVGAEVSCQIDWERRFDLMQQHTGEHILSGILHSRYGAHNVGFHMGAEVTTIDFDIAIPFDDLNQLEDLANQAIFENLPVSCEYPSEEKLKTIPYRSKKELMPPVRIVTIGKYDCCACCGVHTATSGEVGLIKILSCVKFHQGVRMEIVCGMRALKLFQQVYTQGRQVCQVFSAKIHEIGTTAQKFSDALAAEKSRCATLAKQRNKAVAKTYVNQGNVFHFSPDLTPTDVRELADAIAEVCGGIAGVFSGTNFCLISKLADVTPLGQALCQSFGGRGGGKNGVFQGSLSATPAEISQFWKENLS